MKIAFCLFKYFPFGGLQRDFLRIAIMCCDAGHQVKVYTMNWQGERPANISIEILPKTNFSNHANALQFAKMVKDKIAEQPVDLLIGFDKIPNLDIYYCADSCYTVKVEDQKNKFIKWLYSLTNRYRAFKYLEKEVFDSSKQTKILFLSEDERQKYHHAYQLDSRRCFLLPPNINKVRFQPITDHNQLFKLKCDLAYQHDLDYNSYWLLMVGSGFRTKGVDRSIALTKFLLNNNLKINLLVIGQDNPSKFIKLAEQLKVDKQVKFLGAQENIRDFMATASLLIHPAYRENTGTVILESIIMGLPVIATGICGYAKYVSQAECGQVLAEPFQQSDFNNTVYELLTNEKKLELQSASGLNFREQADIYNADGKILRVIENA